jgi:hypothetical protein
LSRCEAAFELSRTGALQFGDRLMRSRGGSEPERDLPWVFLQNLKQIDLVPRRVGNDP